MKVKYVYREGARVPGVKPEVAARELAHIRKTHGKAASAVVDAARPDDAPLHPAFEWDDSLAGEQFRLIQARNLIRAIQVIRDDQPARSVYAYVPAAKGEGEGEYEQIEVLAQQVDRFTLALADAMKFLRSAQDRVEELRTAAGDQPDRAAILTLAAQALSTAEQAFKTLAA